jgi:hypothetical protein
MMKGILYKEIRKMKRKSFTITLMALLALLLSVGGVTGQGPEPEGEVQPEGGLSAAATVGSRISYQGRLTEGGSPVTGDRDMVFRLYSNNSCATQVGSDIVRNDVSVEDGLFSVKLAVTHSDFNGQGLWLRVLVGGTTVVSCEEIVPVPYALGLRPGAVISDASSYVKLNHYVKATFSKKYGVYAMSEGAAAGNYGVYGLASDTSGTAYGVYGQSDSDSGQGVSGCATASRGLTYGVYGESASPDGRGVHGWATASSGPTYGVYGRSNSTSGYGVYGWASANSGPTYGVRGRSDSASGAGVYGFSGSGTGVYGSSSSGVGVHAVSNSDTAVWAETSGGFAAVDGRNTTGTGVYASSDSGYGMHAISDSGVGVRAVSNSDTAVWAETSGGFAAVDGRNTTGYGVYGRSDSGYGVYGRSDSASGAGVYARGTGWGPDLILDGDATTDDGRIYSDPAYSSSDIVLVSNDTIRIDLDNDGGGEDADFEIYDKDDTLIFDVDNSGTTSIRGNLVIQRSSTGVTIIELGEGLDYAEGFDVSDETEIAPGTVLVIDPGHPGELRMSDTAYDRKVAGIVAGAQGMGSAVRLAPGQFDYDVALAGRVYCNVDATEAGVEPGDLLTTSTTPGYAMKVTDYAHAQGAILGKAMEGLGKGEKGQILVLVTLQ